MIRSAVVVLPLTVAVDHHLVAGLDGADAVALGVHQVELVTW